MSQDRRDLLIEIGTEELPPRSLQGLSGAFERLIAEALKEARLGSEAIRSFATPRRLALVIDGLESAQSDTENTRLGPAVSAAFDDAGQPTPAAKGFARSCGVEIEQLGRSEKDGVEKLSHTEQRQGQATAELLPDIISKALDSLPIPKRMRWGSSRHEFVRPLQWLLVLFGDKVVDMTLMGVESDRFTRGHRFMSVEPIRINEPAEYVDALEDAGSVIPGFDKRREMIREQIEELAEQSGGRALLDASLLDEVTSLVEYPVALVGEFDESFLEIPAEALVLSLQSHQKCFCLENSEGELLPRFIAVSNLASKDPQQVVDGNERVIRPRLADARFFFETDKKTTLESRLPALGKLKFQDRLGSVLDKSRRVSLLARWIGEQLKADPEACARAADLAKADLLTLMVNEFADLQGLMGYYYALHDGESEEVARAINEQYQPRQAGAALPETQTGAVLAIAEKVDTLVGLFGIGEPPTGSRDPFALRRSAIGILRILVEKQLDLDIRACLQKSCESYEGIELEEGTVQGAFDFIMERFKAWYADEGVETGIVQAVLAVAPVRPLDFHRRVQAVSEFANLEEAEALAGANKRVSNLLAKQNSGDSTLKVNEELLQEEPERALFSQLRDASREVDPLFASGDYSQGLQRLAGLRTAVDSFLDDVLVMSDDEKLRNNRLALLAELRALFLRTADISHLHAA